MNRDCITKIVVVGGGTAGWMTASALARYLEKQPVEVVLVESDEIATVGVGEATVPIIKQFNDFLGIDEFDFVSNTSGSFKLGIDFRGWGLAGSRFFHGFGDYGAPIDGVAPHHHWLKLRSEGETTPIEAYSFPAQAALQNRFAQPPKDPRLAAAAYRYAYHFDAVRYARYLRRYAENRGVKRVEGLVNQISRHQESGAIAALSLSSGDVVTGDFFIDCSGFRGLLIKEVFDCSYVDWSHWLPCDRAIVAPCRLNGDFTPYTTSTALDAGWQWRIPLQHRVGNGYVHSSHFTDHSPALDRFLCQLEADPEIAPRVLKFTAGHRDRFWVKNCLAIGLAGGFMEPLESTSIQLIQTGLFRFLEHFPAAQPCEATIAEYNRITSNEYARMRDFLIAHYCTSQRQDSEFWRYCRAMALPDELRHKLEVFSQTGRVPLLAEESYSEASWVAIFIGQGVIPKSYSARADFLDHEALQGGMNNRRRTIEKLVGTMPAHDRFVKESCQLMAEATN